MKVESVVRMISESRISSSNTVLRPRLGSPVRICGTVWVVMVMVMVMVMVIMFAKCSQSDKFIPSKAK
jgi:tryptophan-rich sensory protein